jgi:DtxR family Mn-dependent transcriptional regulator
MHPLVTLLLGTSVLALATLLFWPQRGLFWRVQRSLQMSERVLFEDALKHLFDFEYRDVPATLQSVAGALEVTPQRASEVLQRMERSDLVQFDGTLWTLSPAGRGEALRVVRIHRLWENYFSEETGLEPARWHGEAERLEHRTSEAEAELLSARMGHPRWDPHGDPIPTAEGEIAPPSGQPLPTLEVGRIAEIVHIEDEPPESYAQLLAEGLHLGMRVRVNDVSSHRVVFEADSTECVLAPVMAAHISVQPLETSAEMPGPLERLSDLDTGETGSVVGFLPACRGMERRRLLDLGLIPGTQVAAELRSPSGDPTGYRIRGAVIALRKAQADHIQIERAS